MVCTMGLPIPDEPEDVKSFIRDVRSRLGPEKNIDWDNLAVWAFNRLPKYLWSVWKEDLKAHGVTWQKFLKILRFHTLDMVDWALYDKLEWQDLIKRILSTIERAT